MHTILLIGLSGSLYCIAYLVRFRHAVSIPNAVLDWMWQQLVLLGTSQFCYVLGLVCRRSKWFVKLRAYMHIDRCMNCTDLRKRQLTKIVILRLPMIAFAGHCVIQSAIVAPVTAATVLICLFTVKQPHWIQQFLLFMGKHSTNIWLVHMFFYLILFENFVFIAKYLLFIFALMLTVCLGISWAINQIY